MPSPPHPRLRNRHSLPRAVSNGAPPSDYAARKLWTAIPCDSLECCRAIPTVAVGTTIADRPPHRSVQARLRIRLLLWMSGGKAGVRIRMQNAGLRNPPVQERDETIPSHLGALTATD